MITLKQLTSCNIYDENGAPLGQAHDVLFDKSSGKCLLAVNDAVYAVCCNSVKTKKITASRLQANIDTYPTVLNKSAYDASGKLLGTVTNAIIGKTTVINKLILDNGQLYGRGRISAIGDIVIIKTARQSKPKPKKQIEHMSKSATAQVKTSNKEINGNSAPIRRRYGDFSFLLGKTADKNITNFFGEIMIRRGDKVTADILRQAKISGKLIELCLHVN